MHSHGTSTIIPTTNSQKLLIKKNISIAHKKNSRLLNKVMVENKNKKEK